LDRICAGLTQMCKSISFSRGSVRPHIATPSVSLPMTYKSLQRPFKEEARVFDEAVVATNIPYDNNYFFEGYDGLTIFSFAGWNLLTDLPVTNGFVYFALLIALENIGIRTERHYENTGCINDFLGDKRGINACLRAAFFCKSCRDSIDQSSQEFKDIENVLDLLARASRSGHDICDAFDNSSTKAGAVFDVFLCHNSVEKEEVREIGAELKAAGVRTWLDDEQLLAGRPWQPELEKQIATIKTAAVFVGAAGFGPWQDVEIRAFLSEFVRRSIPVIPVILPSAKSVPDLPLFLQAMTWVDMRKDSRKAMDKLVLAIRA
jgi:nucleotide-binding universal stress UspA family protein